MSRLNDCLCVCVSVCACVVRTGTELGRPSAVRTHGEPARHIHGAYERTPRILSDGSEPLTSEAPASCIDQTGAPARRPDGPGSRDGRMGRTGAPSASPTQVSRPTTPRTRKWAHSIQCVPLPSLRSCVFELLRAVWAVLGAAKPVARHAACLTPWMLSHVEANIASVPGRTGGRFHQRGKRGRARVGRGVRSCGRRCAPLTLKDVPPQFRLARESLLKEIHLEHESSVGAVGGVDRP